MSHPTSEPPKQPGPILVTLALPGGPTVERVGFWSAKLGFQAISTIPVDYGFPPPSPAKYALPLIGPAGITHWRSFDEPAGDVTWEVEQRLDGGWVIASGVLSDRDAAVDKIADRKQIGYRFPHRIVEVTTTVTRRVVGPKEEENES